MQKTEAWAYWITVMSKRENSNYQFATLYWSNEWAGKERERKRENERKNWNHMKIFQQKWLVSFEDRIWSTQCISKSFFLQHSHVFRIFNDGISIIVSFRKLYKDAVINVLFFFLPLFSLIQKALVNYYLNFHPFTKFPETLLLPPPSEKKTKKKPNIANNNNAS